MTPKSRWLLIGGTVALAVAIGVTWASLASTSPQESLPLETIGTGDIEKVVLVTGVLKPAVQVNVGAQVNGQLRKLYVRQGEKVQKGQLLAEIDPLADCLRLYRMPQTRGFEVLEHGSFKAVDFDGPLVL